MLKFVIGLQLLQLLLLGRVMPGYERRVGGTPRRISETDILLEIHTHVRLAI
jgi:hypothetical protein